MRIVIVGGTGLIGRKLATILRSKGHDVVSASPSSGVDSVSGVGLEGALDGADTVVDVTNSPSFDEQAVLEFFRSSTNNLLSAATKAGTAHFVALSVVGADRIRDSAYLRAKRMQEQLIESGRMPYTILRATQFFEFLDAISGSGAEGGTIHLSPSKFQPVAADDVASTLADIVGATPKNGVVELAGPEVSSLAAFVQSFLASKGDARKVIPDPDARYFGAIVDENGLAPVGEFILGATRFADWKRAS